MQSERAARPGRTERGRIAAGRRLSAAIGLAVSFVLGGAAASDAVTITFDDIGLAHGEIVTSQYVGITFSAQNLSRSFDHAVAFGSTLSGTRDSDLEAPGGAWSGGNLVGTEIGNLLILQENDTGCGDGVCDEPDDEGNRPAGWIQLDLATPVLDFGFDLIDVDDTTMEMGSVVFSDGLGSNSVRDFATLLAALQVGDNTANRIAPFSLADLGLSRIASVRFDLGGSGAIDNLTFTPVPEPGTALLVGLGLGLLGSRRRR